MESFLIKFITLTYVHLKGWTFISVLTWKISIGATIGGVDVPFSTLALKSINSIQEIEPRIITANFMGNLTTTIVKFSCYSPTNSSDEDNTLQFYQSLSSLEKLVSKHNLLIMGGEMNAQMGRVDTHKFVYHASPRETAFSWMTSWRKIIFYA